MNEPKWPPWLFGWQIEITVDGKSIGWVLVLAANEADAQVVARKAIRQMERWGKKRPQLTATLEQSDSNDNEAENDTPLEDYKDVAVL